MSKFPCTPRPFSQSALLLSERLSPELWEKLSYEDDDRWKEVQHIWQEARSKEQFVVRDINIGVGGGVKNESEGVQNK